MSSAGSSGAAGTRLIDLPAVDDWLAVSHEARALLPFATDNLQIQVYAGFQHAVFEACRGLARLFSHKKSIALVDGLEPALESIAVEFSEEAYDVKRVGAAERADFVAWVTAAVNETVFVLFAEDDPVTGRLHDRAWLEPARDKRIFRVSVSHASWRTGKLERPLPFEVKILSLRDDLALLVAGERFRVIPQLAPRLSWRLGALAGMKLGAVEADVAKIEAFEAALPAGFRAYFKAGEPRVTDRAVIYHPELDGSAILDLLNLTDRTQADTTSLCRRPQPRVRDWLIARGESEEIVRGLLVISTEAVTSDFSAKLAQAERDLLKLQRG